MSIDEPPQPDHDLATDEPDLPDDAQLEELAPDLPPLETDPMAPMNPVPPGPESAVSPQAGTGVPDDASLTEMADAVEEGHLPE